MATEAVVDTSFGAVGFGRVELGPVELGGGTVTHLSAAAPTWSAADRL